MVAISPVSARAPPMLRIESCRARPMLALARLPGPRQLVPALMPSWRAIGPCTQSATQAVPVVVAIPSRLKSGSSVATAAASTTFISSGRQPAIRQLGIGQDLLRGLPGGRLADDRPAAPVAHRAMRTEATVVPPNDGMN